MADQITFTAARRRINEGSHYAVVARFRTRASGDVTPTNVYYRLDCLATGQELLDWTSVAPGTTATLTLTPAQNAIQYSGNARERKQLTVSADRGLSTEFNESLVYQVENLAGVSS